MMLLSLQLSRELCAEHETGGLTLRTIRLDGLSLSLTGLVLGLVGALWLSRAGSSLLFGVSTADPLTFVAVQALLTGVATAACYFPPRRAMKVEPIVALLHE
jgi:putative ABC transport system permease protein